MAVIVIKPVDREAWLQARSQDVTASVAACLFRDANGVSANPFMTAYRLWALKTGSISDDLGDSPVLLRGRILEEPNIKLLAERNPDWQVQYPLDNAYYRDPDLRIGATPDAFAVRPDIAGFGVVQAKSVEESVFKKKWLDADTGEIVVPLWIVVQANIEARLSGASWACVSVLIVGFGVDQQTINIPLHDRLFEEFVRLTKEFWAVVNSGQYPPIDWDRDGETILDVYRDSKPARIDLSDDDVFDILAGRLIEARDQKRAIVSQEQNLKAQLMHMLGSNEAAVGKRYSASAPTRVRKRSIVEESQSRTLNIRTR